MSEIRALYVTTWLYRCLGCGLLCCRPHEYFCASCWAVAKRAQREDVA